MPGTLVTLLMGPSAGQWEARPPSRLPRPIRIVTPTPEAPRQGDLGPPLLTSLAVSQLVRRSSSSLTLNPPAPAQSSRLENWRRTRNPPVQHHGTLPRVTTNKSRG